MSKQDATRWHTPASTPSACAAEDSPPRQSGKFRETYRYIFQSNLNVSSAIERIEAELPATKERDEILLFVRNSRRGIIKGYC